MKRLLLFALVVVSFAFTGCNKDEDPVSPEVTKLKITEKLDKLNVPPAMQNSDNENAKQAVVYVEEVKNIASYFDFFDVPDNAEHTSLKSTINQDEYYWTDGQSKIWEIYTETSGGYTWQIDVDMGYGRQKYLYAEEDKDGNYGNMKIYDFTGEYSAWLYQYEWTFNLAGDATLILDFADGSMKYEIKSNVDYSGYAKIYMSGALFYEFLWNSDGSGSMTTYGDNGEAFHAETWTEADL